MKEFIYETPQKLRDIRLFLRETDYPEDEYKKILKDIKLNYIKNISEIYFFYQHINNSILGEHDYPVTILHIKLFDNRVLFRLNEYTQDFYMVYFNGFFAYHVSEHQNVDKFLQDVTKKNVKTTNVYKY